MPADSQIIPSSRFQKSRTIRHNSPVGINRRFILLQFSLSFGGRSDEGVDDGRIVGTRPAQGGAEPCAEPLGSRNSLTGDRSRNAVGIGHGRWASVEGVGDADHHVEKRADVDGLGDLRVGPPAVSEVLDRGVVDEVRVPRQRVDHREELSFRIRHG